MSNTTENIRNIKLSRWFSYTPHIYKSEDWKKHKKIFIYLQLAPLILGAVFAYFEEGTDVAIVYGFVAPLFNIGYYILTILNIAVYILAIYENKKYAYQLNKVLVEERVSK